MSRQKNDAETRALVLGERMMARLRLRHLRLLASLERSTTLREAAQEVGITQPAASQVLRELEEMLEVQLFERHARGLRATDASRCKLELCHLL
jgi:molybdenum-dependent DNA-binding transcriptional regulator ModE